MEGKRVKRRKERRKEKGQARAEDVMARFRDQPRIDKQFNQFITSMI